MNNKRIKPHLMKNAAFSLPIFVGRIFMCLKTIKIFLGFCGKI